MPYLTFEEYVPRKMSHKRRNGSRPYQTGRSRELLYVRYLDL